MKSGILLTLLSVVVYNACVSSIDAKKVNDRPIIAVLAMKYPQDSGNQSYIAASYVKYLESAGARVVPIPHHFSASKVKSIFKHVNGVLFPGGGAHWFISDYYKHAKQFFDLAIEANDKGNFFPVWGTCLGFEALHLIRTNRNILKRRRSSDVSLPLNYTKEAQHSRLLRGMSHELFSAMGRERITYNHHNFGVAPMTYKLNPLLNKFYNVLSTNMDESGIEFVSTIEAFDYPIYGVQWHPEKSNFEFTKIYKDLPHSAKAVLVTQYMANFLVNEARKNFQEFPSKQMEDDYLIYKYTPVHSAKIYHKGSLSRFEQVYLF